MESLLGRRSGGRIFCAGDAGKSDHYDIRAHAVAVSIVACAHHRAAVETDPGCESDLACLYRSLVDAALHMAGGKCCRIGIGEHTDQAVANGLADPTTARFGGRGEYPNAIADLVERRGVAYLLIQACAAADVSEQNCETAALTGQAVDILAAITYAYGSGAKRQVEYNSRIVSAVRQPHEA